MARTKTKPAMPAYSIQADNDNEPVKVVPPTKQRLAAANDNYAVDHETGSTRMNDTPVERLHNDGRLGDAQLAAAKRYYADWYAAGMAPLGATDYGRPMVDGTSPKTESDFRLGALQRYNTATDLLSVATKEVIFRVVLLEAPLVKVGRSRGWKSDSQGRAVAMDRLDEGLTILAKRYGLGR